MARAARGARASHASPGATALRERREGRDPRALLLVEEIGSSGYSAHARGRVLPTADALAHYRVALGLSEEDFFDGPTRARLKRFREKLERLQEVPS
jgi:hypothetical protein